MLRVTAIDDRRRFLAVCAVGLLILALGCTEPEKEVVTTSGAAEGANIILISVDTLRADRINSFGYQQRVTSPRIDALVAQSTRFAEASAPRGLTWPSLASVLTGQYPAAHGLIQNGFSFDDDQSTMPRLLQQEGYQTAAFLSNMCKANHTGWDHRECAGGVDGRVLRGVERWLPKRDAAQPFFLWAHFFGAHGPYYNGGDRAHQWQPNYEGPVGAKKHLLNRIMTDQIELNDNDVSHLDALYDAAVAGTDDHVGRLLDLLAAAGALEDAVIVFLADHGEDLYDHNGYLYHACSPYESTLHVPLLVRLPGARHGGQTVNSAVELIDVLPTLFDLLGTKIETCVDGRSLVPFLDEPERSSQRPALSEYGEQEVATIRQGDWKLVINPEQHQPLCLPGAPDDLYPIPEVALYNLQQDPLEQTNLATVHTDQVDHLRALLTRRRSASCQPRGSEQDVPEALRKELENMGYVTR